MILFLGGSTAGMVGLLTLVASGHRPDVVGYSEEVSDTARWLRLKVFASLAEAFSEHSTLDTRPSLIVSVHGREIVPKRILDQTPGINLHPCLYAYKGKDPVGRALEAGDKLFSVGAHWITEEVDRGPVICEYYTAGNIEAKSRAEVYGHLYPLYVKVLLEALRVSL